MNQSRPGGGGGGLATDLVCSVSNTQVRKLLCKARLLDLMARIGERSHLALSVCVR